MATHIICNTKHEDKEAKQKGDEQNCRRFKHSTLEALGLALRAVDARGVLAHHAAAASKPWLAWRVGKRLKWVR